MARVSLVLFAAGAIIVGFAETRVLVAVGIILMACGSGYAPLARSVMSLLIANEHTGLLYTTIGIFEGLGSLVAGPLLSQLFNVGLRRGGGWIGLPFFAAGSMYITSLIIIGFI